MLARGQGGKRGNGGKGEKRGKEGKKRARKKKEERESMKGEEEGRGRGGEEGMGVVGLASPVSPMVCDISVGVGVDGWSEERKDCTPHGNHLCNQMTPCPPAPSGWMFCQPCYISSYECMSIFCFDLCDFLSQ